LAFFRISLSRSVKKAVKIRFEVIKQIKTYLAINPVIGCPSDCKYCFRHDDDIFSIKEPTQIQTKEQVISELLNHRLFLPSSTPLAIHNMATDPFLEKPKKITFELLEELDALKCRNSVGLITKQLVSKDDIAFLESLSSLDINMFITYSEMPKTIEPIGNEKRKQSLRNLSDSKLKTILYWRPIIKYQNTDEKRIETILEFGGNYADAFVLSGLKASPKIFDYLQNQGIRLEGEFDSNHKNLPEDILENILESYKKKEISIPLFKRTSCAISYLKTTSDYNAHWSKPQKNCLDVCPQPQKQRCDSATKPERQKVEFLFKRLGYNKIEFDIHEKYLMIENKLTQEEITYLRHNLLFPVVSK
jgi:DNA repair photolyase